MKSKKILALSLFLIIFSLMLVAAGTNNAKGKSYESSFRKDLSFPKIDEQGGREVLKNKLGVNTDFSDLKFKIDFADLGNKEQIDKIKMNLKIGNKNLPILVRPSESWSKEAKLSNGNTLVWGALTGDLNDNSLGNSITTIGFVEIPEEDKVNFNINIEANDQHPQIYLPFGNLERSEEIVNIIKNN